MFIDNTRQNFTELPAQTYIKGGRLYFKLPSVGLLSRLFLTVKGTMTVTNGTGSTTLSDRLGVNLIKRIKVIANSGTAIYDVSGYGTYLINSIQRKNEIPNMSPNPSGYNDLVYNTPIENGDNDWVFTLEVPIAINEKDPIGLILLQNDATQITLEVEFNDEYGANNIISPIVATGNAVTSFVGNVSCMMEYFTVPREKENYPSLNVLHQWLEQYESITSAGEFTKQLQRGNTYMRLMHYLTLGNALNTESIDKLKIVYNQSETPYTLDATHQLYLQRMRYGQDLQKGTFVHDWYMSNGLVGLGNSRDFINSANVTEFQSIFNIASGTAVPAGQSFVNTLTEQLIKLA